MSAKMIQELVIIAQTLLVDLTVDATMATTIHQLHKHAMVSLNSS